MSPTDSGKDALDDLISKVQKAGAREGRSSVQTGRPTIKTGGLKPSEILFLPENQKRLINFLSHQPDSSIKEIMDALSLQQQEVNDLITTLKEAGFVNEALCDGETRYHVKLKSRQE